MVASDHRDATATWYMHSTVVVVGNSLGFWLSCCRCRLWLRHPSHFILISSTLYIYNVFLHLILWLVFIRAQPHSHSHSHRGRGIFWRLEIHSVFDLYHAAVNLIEAPLHTYSGLLQYIYSVLQHLFTMAIEIQPQPDVCTVHSTVVAVGNSLCFWLVTCINSIMLYLALALGSWFLTLVMLLLWLRHPIHFILFPDLLSIYIMCFSTFSAASGNYMLGFTVTGQSLESLLVSHLQCAVS